LGVWGWEKALPIFKIFRKISIIKPLESIFKKLPVSTNVVCVYSLGLPFHVNVSVGSQNI
jgi:hypothetical protein